MPRKIGYVFLLVAILSSCAHPALQVAVSKTELLANGYDRVSLHIFGSEGKPTVQIVGDSKAARTSPPQNRDQFWESQLLSGVMPGQVRLKVSSDTRHKILSFTLRPQITDSESDGTPDFLRLEDESDKEAFRKWLTYLAEIQYFTVPTNRPAEIVDCSSLVRYAYREALREHNAAWLRDARLPALIAIPSIAKYSFPHTPLGPRIFRTRGGIYAPLDLSSGVFAEFADAKTIQRFNTSFVSKDLELAMPGDVLFYARPTHQRITYHSMIYLGNSQMKPDGQIYVVYHTGPDGTNQGEIRRLTLTQLLRFPDPQWQAKAANPLFLGVYRWNILKTPS